jgi:hypothetical protein
MQGGKPYQEISPPVLEQLKHILFQLTPGVGSR